MTGNEDYQPMKTIRIIVMITAVAVCLCLLIWWGGKPRQPAPLASLPPATAPAALRIGLVPEYDLYVLRPAYQELARYIGRKLGQTVEVRTLSDYQGVLLDMQEKNVDAAFLGSLISVLTIDRLGAQPLARPQMADGVSTYRGVIFVRADSPIQSLDQLRGRSIAMLKTTYAGSLVPIAEMLRRHMLDGDSHCRIMWMGTHDEVISAVMTGRADAGAAKDLRLNAFEKIHGPGQLRRLLVSPPVPSNALVVRSDLAASLGPQLRDVLLGMEKDPDAHKALDAIGAMRFVPTDAQEYSAIHDMVDEIGPAWSQVGVAGPAPKRPATRPAAKAPGT